MTGFTAEFVFTERLLFAAWALHAAAFQIQDDFISFKKKSMGWFPSTSNIGALQGYPFRNVPFFQVQENLRPWAPRFTGQEGDGQYAARRRMSRHFITAWPSVGED